MLKYFSQAVHGWLDNAASFQALFPLLPKHLRIVAVDVPGHGLSDPFPSDISYNFWDCLVYIERILNQLKWERFSLIGHSLGGVMALIYSGIFPEKVDKLLLLDIIRASPTRPNEISYRLRKTVGVLLKEEEAIKAGPEKPCSYETAVKRNIIGTGGSVDKKACDILFSRGLKEVEGGFVFRRDRRLMAAPLTFIPKEDMQIISKQITAEILVIKFTGGPYLDSVEDYIEQAELLKTSSKSFNYVKVPGKHHVHLTNPQSIAPMISDFFNA